MSQLLSRKNKIKLGFIISTFLFFHCGTEQFVEPEYLNPPSNVILYPQNNKIKIKFFANNQESTFDGFNVYLSKSSSLKSQSTLLAIPNPSTGGIPTINRSSQDIVLGVPIEIILDRDENDKPLENGITYYCFVKSHSYRNYRSEPSNETSSTPRIDDVSGIILNDQEGFNFSSFNKTPPYHFLFKIIDNHFYFVAQNSSLIQSKGYYQNWELVQKADENGYVTENTPLLIETGYVFIIKTPENKYGKIQITEMNGPSIKFIWAFQNIINNKDI